MLVRTIRNPDGSVDCISMLPESHEEVILMSTIMDDQVNLKRGLELLIKENKIKARGIKNESHT